jgi:hypothetical protein
MVFNATINNISVTSWQSVLLVEDPEKTTDLSQVTDKLYHLILYTSPWSRFELTTAVVIGTDCIGMVVNLTTIRSRPRRLLGSVWWHECLQTRRWFQCPHLLRWVHVTVTRCKHFSKSDEEFLPHTQHDSDSPSTYQIYYSLIKNCQ